MPHDLLHEFDNVGRDLWQVVDEDEWCFTAEVLLLLSLAFSTLLWCLFLDSLLIVRVLSRHHWASVFFAVVFIGLLSIWIGLVEAFLGADTADVEVNVRAFCLVFVTFGILIALWYRCRISLLFVLVSIIIGVADSSLRRSARSALLLLLIFAMTLGFALTLLRLFLVLHRRAATSARLVLTRVDR